MPKKKLNYEDAYNELQSIYTKIESGEISIDHLTTHVKRASELLAFCKDKLRKSETELSNLGMELPKS